MLDGELRAELDGAAHRVAFGPAGRDGRPWVLFGSAVLLLHGLRDEIGDVDVFAQPAVWMALRSTGGWRRRAPEPNDPPFLEREFNVGRVHVFFDWTRRDPEVDARQCLRAAEPVGGWWCAPLEIIRLHKAMARKHGDSALHRKHAVDVLEIDAFLKRPIACAAEPVEVCGSPLFCRDEGCQL